MPKRKRPTKDQNDTQNKPSKEQSEETDLSHSVLGGVKDPTLNSRLNGKEEQDSGISHFTIPLNDKSIVCERHAPRTSQNDEAPSLIFTHGAGGGIANAATRDFARGFGATDVVVCYQGTWNLTNRVKTFHAVVEHQGNVNAALGGRSMGARAAVLTALEMDPCPEALVLVSWPLTAGKEGKREPERREKILKDLPDRVDVLFVVGDRDDQCDLGMLEEVTGEMKARSWICVVKGADHGMSLKQKDGVEAMRLRVGRVAAEWLGDRDAKKRFCEMAWDAEKGEAVFDEWKAISGRETTDNRART